MGRMVPRFFFSPCAVNARRLPFSRQRNRNNSRKLLPPSFFGPWPFSFCATASLVLRSSFTRSFSREAEAHFPDPPARLPGWLFFMVGKLLSLPARLFFLTSPSFLPCIVQYVRFPSLLDLRDDFFFRTTPVFPFFFAPSQVSPPFPGRKTSGECPPY